jgi:hypothetical protein
MLGFMELSEACREVEQACVLQTGVEAPLSRARAAGNRALQQMTELKSGIRAGKGQA